MFQIKETKKIVNITLTRFKQLCKLRGIEFIKWDEKFYWIITTYNTDYIYNPHKQNEN